MGFGFKMPKLKAIDPISAQLGALKGMGFGGGGGGSGPGVPGYSPPKFAMRNTNEFIPKTESIKIGGPNAENAIMRRFGSLREQAGNRASAAGDTAVGAINRKFASLGSSGSGAQMKLQQQALDTAERQKNDAIAGLNNQEGQEIANLNLAQADMDFKQRLANFEQGSKLHELDLAERQQQISSAQDEYSARLNEFLNKPPKKGLLGGLIDDLI